MSTNKRSKKSHPRLIVKDRTNIKRVGLALLLATVGLVVYSYAAQYTYQEKQKVELQRTLQELRVKQTELDKNKVDSVENQKKIEELTKQLQAKKAAATALAEASVTHIQATVAISGTCAEWMAGAGITDVYSATILLNRESHCNPNALNRSSGACGLAQELPCGKSGCSLGDGACQMQWMNRYVLGRYGSWAAAVAWHNSHNWY
jgi:hypothetical protein